MTNRDAFFGVVYQKALVDKRIFVLSADMGAPALDQFRAKLPDQYINTGISEQNTILVGAGLALEEKIPFCYAIAPFITINCLEKIRVQASIMKIPIKIVGVGAGFSYPDSGPTHHGLDDLAIMRALPNIEILSPSTSTEAALCAEYCLSVKKPIYARLDREATANDTLSTIDDLTRGFKFFENQSSTLVISTGLIFNEILSSFGKKFNYINVLKFPLSDELIALIKSEGRPYQRILVIEEHFIMGGLYSAICELLALAGVDIPRMKPVCLESTEGFHYEYGGRSQLRQKYGLILRENL